MNALWPIAFPATVVVVLGLAVAWKRGRQLCHRAKRQAFADSDAAFTDVVGLGPDLVPEVPSTLLLAEWLLRAPIDPVDLPPSHPHNPRNLA